MASAVALALLLGIGAAALWLSVEPIVSENKESRDNETRPTGYDELSNQVVDPGNIRSDPDNSPIIKTEPGPFGIPRNIHDVHGDYRVPTFGLDPGLHHNI